MAFTIVVQWFNIGLFIAILAGFIYIVRLLIKALKKYIGEEKPTPQMKILRMSLAERLKVLRMEHNYTQEFVAEALNVSRQAVSKWENGSSEPSTSNLLALAKLYGISAAELLQNIDG